MYRPSKKRKIKKKKKKPAIVNIETGVAVVGEASAESRFGGKFPDGVGILPANALNPTGAGLDGDAAELLLPYTATYSVRRLQHYKILHPTLRELLHRRYSCSEIHAVHRQKSSLEREHRT